MLFKHPTHIYHTRTANYMAAEFIRLGWYFVLYRNTFKHQRLIISTGSDDDMKINLKTEVSVRLSDPCSLLLFMSTQQQLQVMWFLDVFYNTRNHKEETLNNWSVSHSLFRFVQEQAKYHPSLMFLGMIINIQNTLQMSKLIFVLFLVLIE